ncbi:PREDICTED: F-box protein At5g25290-like [Camelina sativa]|uniref:F-box protein At5g25290-like n=1 Tax=Camelina sativa TaxID=90675 RepID=A0ABM0WZR8_CAMSA|nr:PREDICTED: F-box protein At5g25290-like [Camelina sativa]
MEEVVDRPADGVGNSKRSGSPKYNECIKVPRPALVFDPKSGSLPLLLLSLEESGCRVYNPDEDKVYETKSDFSGCRFLANSGKWFLVLDESRSDLYIVDVFSEERIHLPPLESTKGGLYNVERVGDNEFNVGYMDGFRDGFMDGDPSLHTIIYLRGLLWVDDKNGDDYVVVWQFHQGEFLGFCKKGDSHYRDIPIRVDVRREFRGLNDVVLKGYSVYYLATRGYIRHLDLSGQDGFKDVSELLRFPMWNKPDLPSVDFGKKVISSGDSIAVTTSGEVLLVFTRAYEPICETSRIFRVYKRKHIQLNPKYYDTILVEVESIGDEALFYDLSITVPANHILGIEPNSIYFTRNDRFGLDNGKSPCLDICVYNIATRNIKHFPSLFNLNLKDAQWFLPS